VKAPACHQPSKADQKALTAQIVKEFEPTEGGKPEVKFPCDGLGDKIAEIVIETGSGHGGSLDLWRATRRSDGKYDVRGILYQGGALAQPATDPVHQQARATVDLPGLDAVRAAMTATVREVVPPPKPGEMRGIKGSGSSRDFHIVLRLVDEQGRVVERRYTGYAGSSHQSSYLGLEVALSSLTPITSLQPDDKPADQDDKAFFAASFNAAVPHFDEEFYWWVMERYVDMARLLGTRHVIGGLLTRLDVKDPDDRSKVDARADAVEALANITGWDARKTTKTIEAAAAAYLAACK
jgi:hypothetical protein